MKLTLEIWRQKDARAEGGSVTYRVDDVSPDMSFLEMLDVVNEQLTEKGEQPIHFEHDCREGICGSCGMMINGVAHGPIGGTATCQLHMRHFKDGDELYLEPWRARAFPVVGWFSNAEAATGAANTTPRQTYAPRITESRKSLPFCQGKNTPNMPIKSR